MNSSNPKVFNDQQLIAGIREGGKIEHHCLKHIYGQNLNTITRFVMKNGGNKEEGIEIFQESIIALYEKIKDPEFKLNSNTRLSTFLYSIAKNKWLYKQRKKRKMVNVQEKNQSSIYNPWDELIVAEKRSFIKEMMNRLGENCQKILIFSIYEQRKMDEISQLMGFKNAQIARNKKHKCLKYLKEIVLRFSSKKQIVEKD